MRRLSSSGKSATTSFARSVTCPRARVRTSPGRPRSPPSRVYRLKKLILRNKAVFAAGAALALALAAGLGITILLRVQERELRVAAEHGPAVEAEWREGIRQVAALIYGNAYAEADLLMIPK